MERRRFLRRASIASVIAVAGCGAPEGEGTDMPGETPIAEDTLGGVETTAGEETPAGDQTGNQTAGGGAEGAPSNINMVTDGSDNYFDPIGLFVEPGTTVAWVNDSGSHSSTAYAEGNGGASVSRIPADAEPWNSGILSEEGAEFTYTFEVPGTYDYFCIPHKSLGMVGRIVVGEPGGVSGMPPDGNVPEPQRIVEEGSVGWSQFQGG